MKGLSPEVYGLTLDEIALLIAHARRDEDKPQEVLRQRYLVSDEQAQEWVNAAYKQNLVPDHNKMPRPR